MLKLFAVKFETKVIKPNLCDYSDAYILVTGNIAVVGGYQNIDIAFKICCPFTRCVTHLNDEHVEIAEIIRHCHEYVQFN